MESKRNYLRSFFGHLHTINHHRLLVCRLCFKMGLYKQGLLHDLSKYSPAEFIPGVKYYQGYRSPIAAEIEEHGYSSAWLHHKGRNRHHWQYWTAAVKGELKGIEMPIKYIKEMACDRIAACMVYQKEKYTPASALEFLNRSSERKLIPPETLAILTDMLEIVAGNDLDEAVRLIRNKY